jgi:hypothetical protein
LPFWCTAGAHWLHSSPSSLRTTISLMKRPDWPEKRLGRSNEAVAFIGSLRSWWPKSLKGLLELAGTLPQKFEMRPVWSRRSKRGGQPEAEWPARHHPPAMTETMRSRSARCSVPRCLWWLRQNL